MEVATQDRMDGNNYRWSVVAAYNPLEVARHKLRKSTWKVHWKG